MKVIMTIDNPLNITFLVLLVYYVEVHRFNINYITYGMLIYHFFCLTLLILSPRSSTDPNQISTFQLLSIASKSLITLQVVFGILKWTGTIIWSWYQTFVIFWISLGTIVVKLGIIILIEVCLLVDYIIKSCRKDPDIQHIEEFKLACNLLIN